MDSLRQACDLSPVPALLSAADGVIELANEVAHAALGYPPGQLVGCRLADLVADDARPGFEEVMRTREAPGAIDLEIDLRRNDGIVFLAHVSSLFIPTPSGSPCVWTTLHDLSEREALARSEAAFRALGEATSEAVVLHRDGRIVLTNGAADVMFGVVRPTGRSLLDFVAPEARADVIARMVSHSAEAYESVAMRADGTPFPVEARGATVRYQGETLRVVTLRDLTERRRLERQLAVADRLASMGMLASGVAHEINNPLAYVVLHLDLIREELGAHASAEVADSLQHALEGSQRIRAIVDDLRQLARDPRGDDDAAEVREAVQRAASVARQTLRHAATLTIDVPEGLWVTATPGRLGQVFLNLLLNAAEAIGPGAAHDNQIRVTAGSSDDGGLVQIEVSDTGPGVATELLSRVFDPFVTSGDTASTLGLGLSIVHGIVTDSGGTVDVVSVAGEGTRFVVRLPSVAPPKSSPAAPQSAAAGRGRPRVLVVDDEAGVREVIRALLATDYVVTVASSGAEALTLLESDSSYDVVVCDWLMPQMGGDALLAVAQERWPALVARWVVMSGGTFPPTTPGAVGPQWLSKPFRAAELKATIQAALARVE